MSEPITIRKITLYDCRLKDKDPKTYTGGVKDAEYMVWFFVAISDGRATGYGECIPSSVYYSDRPYDPRHGWSRIDEWAELVKMCQGLIGKDARMLGALVPFDADQADANSIKDSVDFALHDLVGRKLNVPVAVLLGGIRRPYVWGIKVIHTDTPDAMAKNAAEKNRKYGYRYFKLKPIGEPEADVETLAKMRELMGPEVRYTMDANFELKEKNVDRVIDYINRLAALGLIAYEDPIDTDFKTYRYIAERIKAKLMLDAKAHSLQAVLEIIQNRCAGMINIHADWAAGFQPAILKAKLAMMGGMPTMIGSTWYIGPGAAAYETLASVLPLEAMCEQNFSEDLRYAIDEPYELRDGKHFIPDKPGLGVTPKMEAVEELSVKKEMIE